MQLLNLTPLPIDAYLEVADGVVRLKGHRIGIEHIVERYREGWSAEQIALDYPSVELKKIYAVIAYYLYNQAVVDAYIAELNAEGEAAYQVWATAEPSPATLRVRQLRASESRG
jgi:uncharacterized protein (DUF433 family)